MNERRELASLSAPSMHKYLALRRGFARFRISAIIGPVKRAVERPAGPHEKPFDFRTVFCSFRRFPAQTRVIGDVNWSKCSRIWRKFRVIGLSTSLDVLELDADNKDRKRKIDGDTYPSIVISQLGMSSSRT